MRSRLKIAWEVFGVFTVYTTISYLSTGLLFGFGTTYYLTHKMCNGGCVILFSFGCIAAIMAVLCTAMIIRFYPYYCRLIELEKMQNAHNACLATPAGQLFLKEQTVRVTQKTLEKKREDLRNLEAEIQLLEEKCSQYLQEYTVAAREIEMVEMVTGDQILENIDEVKEMMI